MLAIYNFSTWSALLAIITASVKAHLEFQGTNNKIGRYAATVHGLRELLLWWEELPPHERFVVSNVENIVIASEELIKKEFEAWKSTSDVIKLLQKQVAVANSKV